MTVSEPDYVTILPTNTPNRFLVVVMTYHARDEEYIQKRVSQESHSKTGAALIATAWSKALNIEVRL